MHIALCRHKAIYERPIAGTICRSLISLCLQRIVRTKQNCTKPSAVKSVGSGGGFQSLSISVACSYTESPLQLGKTAFKPEGKANSDKKSLKIPRGAWILDSTGLHYRLITVHFHCWGLFTCSVWSAVLAVIAVVLHLSFPCAAAPCISACGFCCDVLIDFSLWSCSRREYAE